MKDSNVFRVLPSLAVLTRQGDHIGNPTGMKKGCKLHIHGTKLDRQGALYFAEALV